MFATDFPISNDGTGKNEPAGLVPVRIDRYGLVSGLGGADPAPSILSRTRRLMPDRGTVSSLPEDLMRRFACEVGLRRNPLPTAPLSDTGKQNLETGRLCLQDVNDINDKARRNSVKRQHVCGL